MCLTAVVDTISPIPAAFWRCRPVPDFRGAGKRSVGSHIADIRRAVLLTGSIISRRAVRRSLAYYPAIDLICTDGVPGCFDTGF